jgi:hypothetical protein
VSQPALSLLKELADVWWSGGLPALSLSKGPRPPDGRDARPSIGPRTGAERGTCMFDSLEHEIENTEGGRPKTSEKLMRFAGIAVIAVLVFGGLCALIISLE